MKNAFAFITQIIGAICLMVAPMTLMIGLVSLVFGAGILYLILAIISVMFGLWAINL